MNSERRDVDLDRFRNLQRQTFDGDLAHQRLQNAAIDDSHRAPDELERHRDPKRAVEVDLVQVGVQDIA